MPTRILCPWDFLGKNTGVGCHALLQGGLPDPEIGPASLASSSLAGGFFTTRATWETPAGEAKKIKNLREITVFCLCVYM